ncbi:hypothetical protein QWO07_004096 [Escherichia coli]|nr:hypothetical protein [Escherichia coli]HAY0097503.1 hypothetical protein [Escherichia coli]
MKKNYNIFIMLLCLLYAKITMADNVFTPSNQTFNVNESFATTNVPDTWLKLGKLNLGTMSEITNYVYPCSPYTFICTAGEIGLGYNGKASYILNLRRYAATISDDAGNTYMLTVAFPDRAPAVGIYERNNRGGNRWNTLASIDNNFSSPPNLQQDIASAFASTQGYCGNINGCDYSVGAYMHSNSGMPYVYVKLPKNLSAKSVTFKDVKVLELELIIGNKAGNNVHPTTAKLYLSGTISVPQRCYIKADKNNFDFGTIYSNAGNGILKNVSTSVTTDCYYAPGNTQQYLKMEAVSGGALNTSSMRYQIASDSALGIVFNINNNPDCNSTTDNKNLFNKEYLIRSIPYQQHYTATDKVNFALCKYGMPSVTGQKNVILKLTSRWVVN